MSTEDRIQAAKFYGWTHRDWAQRVEELEAEIARLNRAITLRAEGTTRPHIGSDWNSRPDARRS